MKKSGFYRITCTAHYTPVATGPFESREAAADFGFANRLDSGVYKPPPFIVRAAANLEEAEEKAAYLAAVYECESCGHQEGCGCPDDMPLFEDED